MVVHRNGLEHLIVYKHPDQNIPMHSQRGVRGDECAIFWRRARSLRKRKLRAFAGLPPKRFLPTTTIHIRDEMGQCPTCGRRFSGDAAFCPFDGVALVATLANAR
jgi:hypothetical protein